jgi:acetyl-CoA acetyltransferase
MDRPVIVAGIGMTPFVSPSRAGNYLELGARAIREALGDAGLDYAAVEQVYAGYVYGDSTSGQAVAYQVGMTGVPVINVNNNCSTGSTALFLARQAVASGAVECALAVGFEQMTPGALSEHWNDRPTPLKRFLDAADVIQTPSDAPLALRLFGGAGEEYKKRYGAGDALFASVAVKARRHAEHNERAIFREPLTVDEVGASPHLFGVLTRLQCCPPSCGGAAAIVCSEPFARRYDLATKVRIRAQAMTTDGPETFEAGSMMTLVGYDMSRAAADQAYAAGGIAPEELDAVELHDCFTANEVLTYEALRLTPEGTAEQFVADGENTYGGRVVTNPSGGLLAKGHPLGATGLAQCFELVTQLRGRAGPRQVDGARLALAHNIGLGGACLVTLYEAA